MPDRLRLGGVILAMTVILFSVGIPLVILTWCYKINTWLGIVAEGIMCYYMIAPKCLKTESMKVYSAVKEGDTEKARFQ